MLFAAVANTVWRVFNPSRLTGPIFDKELRVSSRRKRNYVLRFVYIAVLTLFIVLSWQKTGGFRGAASYSYVVSRMAEVGRELIGTVLVFQFFAMQLLTVAFLITSFRDEIRRRTLPLLLTTPITSWQIVMGKLLSRLLPLFMLLAICLPLMAIVRVFGGIPWSDVIAGLGITAAAMVLTGSATMLAAVMARTLFGAMLLIVLAYGLVFVMGAVLAPMFVYTLYTSWPLSCLIILGVAALLLAITSRQVPHLARKCLDQNRSRGGRPEKKAKPAVGLRGVAGATRRVHGSPLIWKELRFYTPNSKRHTIMAASAAVGVLILAYCGSILSVRSSFEPMHVFYILLYFTAAVIVLAILASGAISSERESRALPLLLSIPVSDEHIILAKILGVLYRAAPAWILLAVHLLVFVALGSLHPVILPLLGMLIIWTTVFLTGLGLYLSLRCRSVSLAAVITIATCVVLWMVLPFAVGYVSGVLGREIRLFTYANPFVQLIAITKGAAGAASQRTGLADPRFIWWAPEGGSGVGKATLIMLINMLCYSAAGLIFAWQTRRRLRTYAFEGTR